MVDFFRLMCVLTLSLLFQLQSTWLTKIMKKCALWRTPNIAARVFRAYTSKLHVMIRLIQFTLSIRQQQRKTHTRTRPRVTGSLEKKRLFSKFHLPAVMSALLTSRNILRWVSYKQEISLFQDVILGHVQIGVVFRAIRSTVCDRFPVGWRVSILRIPDWSNGYSWL